MQSTRALAKSQANGPLTIVVVAVVTMISNALRSFTLLWLQWEALFAIHFAYLIIGASALKYTLSTRSHSTSKYKFALLSRLSSPPLQRETKPMLTLSLPHSIQRTIGNANVQVYS